jgi:hypothetical protein
MRTIIQYIETHLHAIEQHKSLFIPSNFVERVAALNRLEVHFIRRLKYLLYSHGYHTELASLQQRSTRLQHRLAAVNAALFGQIRDQIISGTHSPAGLRQLFHTYLNPALGDAPSSNLIFYFDSLDVFIDGIFCINQVPEGTRPIQSEMVQYKATPARIIFSLIDQVPFTADDVLYDLGAGLGRIPLCVGLLSPAQAKGVEYEPAYCTFAQQRADRLNLSRVTFLSIDAREADYTDGTIFFLYTPFTGKMLQDVLDRLRHEAQTRPITVAAYGPCNRDVAQQPWLNLCQPPQGLQDHLLALFTTHKRK